MWTFILVENFLFAKRKLLDACLIRGQKDVNLILGNIWKMMREKVNSLVF